MSGTVDPAAGTGTNGDFYINTATNMLFGPKAAGAWGTGTSLVGPPGQDGSANAWALTGNAGTSASNFIGTTDNTAFEVRVNNSRAGWLSPNGSTSWGVSSLPTTSTGNYNTGTGYGTLYSNSSGHNNTAMGYSAMALNSSGYRNTAMGSLSFVNNTTGWQNTAMGCGTLGFNSSGKNNSAMGYYALYNNTTGNSNVAMGPMALYRNTDRSNIVAVGDSALYNNGLNAQPDNSIEGIYDAHDNTAVGSKALFSNARGSLNTALGFRALYYNSTGFSNVGIGAYALNNSLYGNNNTAVGYFAATNVGTGGNNTAIGAYAGIPGGNNSLSNTGALGYNATPTAANRITIGTSTNNNLTGGFGAWQNLSDGRFKRNVQEDVPGLAFITKLRPVTYNLDAAAVDEYTGVKEKMEVAGKVPDWYAERIREVSQEKLTGFIAQEVEQAAKDAGYDFDGVQHPHGDQDHYTLGYATFVVPLVKAVQEQQVLIEEMRKEIEALKGK
ncbi:MAG: tail fiber domain-containing protein [Bacteroidetes bacterium]|nr:tail fiber domain-containing protein [Bacteroidota bacterium]